MSSVYEIVRDNLYNETLANFISQHKLATAVALGTSAAVLYGAWFLKRPKNLPPGPYGYPLIGSLPLLSADIEMFGKRIKQYGDVICLWLGGNRYVIILNSYEAIKEGYITGGSALMDRHAEEMISVAHLEDTLIFKHYDASYKESRKIGAQALRTIINARLASILDEEASEMEKFIDIHSGKAIDLSPAIQRILTNTITQVLFNKRYVDEESQKLSKMFRNWMQGFTFSFGATLFPRWMMLFMSPYVRMVKKETGELMSFVRGHIKEHKESIQHGQHEDVMYAYLNNKDGTNFSEEQIAATLLVLLPDATFSTFEMSMWVLLYLTNHPDSQEEIHKEIQEVCGSYIEGPSVRSKMPVTESFIMEVFRLVTPFPFGVPGKPLKSFTFRGYNIPEFATILPNYGMVHKDPRFFPEPESFLPRRFIKNGQIGSTEGFMPFGIGRRMCMGEQLVRNEIFYIIARLVLRYRISSQDGRPIPTEHKLNILKSPQAFQLRFEKR